MCSIIVIDLLYELVLWSMCVWRGRRGFGSNGFVIKMRPFSMDGHYMTDFISGVDYLRSNLVVLLVLCTICCAMIGAPALYYKSLEIASTLLKRVISRIDHTVKL
jgi:hypothetical protein